MTTKILVLKSSSIFDVNLQNKVPLTKKIRFHNVPCILLGGFNDDTLDKHDSHICR
jgi:hypothetical protein